MAVEHSTAYDVNGVPPADGQLLAMDQENRVMLLVDETLPADDVPLEEVDNRPGRMRRWDPIPGSRVEDDENIHIIDQTYDAVRDARLAYGLWQSCGPWTEPEGSAVPLEVATEGKPEIAAYLRLQSGYMRPLKAVAQHLDVEPETVSSYCYEVRWTPEE